MSRKYGSNLTYGERCQINTLLKSGNSKRAIGETIGVSHSTIVRETQRNSVKQRYQYQHAHTAAGLRRFHSNSARRRLTSEIQAIIREMLNKTQASPQQISGRLKLERDIFVSHQTIYQFIWNDKNAGGTLFHHLRHRGKKYKYKKGKTAGRGVIRNRVDISERPKEVEDKNRFGDFELDTIVGKNHQGAIVSAVDRATKLVYLALVPNYKAETVKTALIKAMNHLGKKNKLKTLTSDNGKEFSEHEAIADELGAKFFFARPYCSWERGLNEHTNGLVRQYFPKKTDFTKLSKTQVKEVENKLNNRPRASLNFQTPLESLFGYLSGIPGGAIRT